MITVAVVATAAVASTAWTVLKPGATGAVTIVNKSGRSIRCSTYDLGDNVQVIIYYCECQFFIIIIIMTIIIIIIIIIL
jgi:hypothetical protein